MMFEIVVESFLMVLIAAVIFAICILVLLLFIFIDSWLYDQSGGGYTGISRNIHTSQWIFRLICLFLFVWFLLFMYMVTGE